MGYEDFEAYTEVDEDTEITVTSSKIDFDTLSRADRSHVHKDMTAGHFDEDSTHLFEMYMENPVGTAPNISHYGMAQSVGDFGTERGAGKWNVSVESYYLSAQMQIRLALHQNSFNSFDSYADADLSTPYYITVDRDYDGGVSNEGRFTAYVRTGSHTGTLKDTLILDAGVAQDYRYIYGLSSIYTNNDWYADGYTQNLDLQEAVMAHPVMQEYFQEAFQEIGNN